MSYSLYMVKISTKRRKNCRKVNPLRKPSQIETIPTPRIMRMLKTMSVQPIVLAPVNSSCSLGLSSSCASFGAEEKNFVF